MRAKYQFIDIIQKKVSYQNELGDISPFDAGIPLIELSDKTIEEIYYYRWNSFCSHIKHTLDGYVVTEFTPRVPWEGIYGTISCPAGHHMYEGRWLHRKKYLDDYARFWFTEDAELHLYSFWVADAIYKMCQVSGDFTLAEDLYEPLKQNYFRWEEENRMENGLFYQVDDRDGMEFSISGNGCRPTINSYMYGDAIALAKIAARLGKSEEQQQFLQKAADLREKVNTMLWDEEQQFFETLSEHKGYQSAKVRENIGYVPWYFGLPDEDKSVAWKFLMDDRYFHAPYGPTTAERNHPDFMKYFKHECLWNGPSWPFATSQTLTAMGNLLHHYRQNTVKKSDYFTTLHQYAASQYDTNANGEKIPYIDENLDPFTGQWLARQKMYDWETPRKDRDRGVHYNHSSFCDLVLSGLAGLVPRDDDVLQIDPLFTPEDLDYFCVDGIRYHGHLISILWDKTGLQYGTGKGFHIYCDKQKIASADIPCPLNAVLNPL